MLLYLRRERQRLESILEPKPVPSTAIVLTQPLQIDPPHPPSPVQSPIPHQEEETPLPYSFPYNSDDFNEDDNTQMPQINISPILKSTIPKIILKSVPKRNPKKIVKFNKFDNMDWEEINTVLHGIYGHPLSGGCLSIENFDVHAASIDYDALMEIDGKNLADLYLVKTWIAKLRYAIMACPDSDDEEIDYF